MSHAVLFTVSEDYYRSAAEGLAREFELDDVTRVGADAGLATLRRGQVADVAAAARATRLPFIRHLAGHLADSPNAPLRHGEYAVAQWAAEVIASVDEVQLRGRPVALHVWDSGRADHKPGAVRRLLAQELQEIGISPCLSGAEHAIALCLGSKRTVVGLTPSRETLCDWPGGRLRLAATPEQISRAEFKLEELFHHLAPPTGRVAVDLGAAPGGWTRILRSRGFETVHAVDPGELDPRVAADPGVVHHAVMAGEFRWEADDGIDLVACDMRIPPRVAAEAMCDYASLLREGGSFIVTLKLGAAEACRTVEEALRTLRGRYRVTFARQLQHNRHELTVVGTKIVPDKEAVTA